MSFRFALVLSLISSVALLAGEKRSQIRNSKSSISTHSIEHRLEHLSISDKVGQLLQIRVFGDYSTLSDRSFQTALDEVKKYHVGSLLLGARMAGTNLLKEEPAHVAHVINEFQRASDVPLLVASDIERGLASRLSESPEFPFPMAFGAADDPDAVERFGEISAEQARAVGINWSLSPDADVNSNPDNPAIANRAFAEDPSEVSKLVAAYIRGAHKHGLLVTAKHFPGQGSTSTDSHIGITTISSNLAHFKTYEFPPFEAAIREGVDSIMLAHVSAPALDPDTHRVATTSPRIQGYLRKQLGFQGIIVTDALEMRGLTKLYPNVKNSTAHAAVDAIKAGADVIMWPDDIGAAYNGILNAVRSGEIPESRIDESVRRILLAKEKLGLFKSKYVDINHLDQQLDEQHANEFAQKVADESVTLVRNDRELLPVKAANPDAGKFPDPIVTIIFSDSKLSPLGRQFQEALIARRPDAIVHHYYYDNINSDVDLPRMMSAIEGAKQVILAAFVTHMPGYKLAVGGKEVGVFGLAGDNATFFRKVLDAAGKKAVVISLGSPYFIRDYPDIPTYICTYSTAKTSELSAVKAIFGEIQNKAKLPVTLPGIAGRGFAVPWPQAETSTSAQSTGSDK